MRLNYICWTWSFLRLKSVFLFSTYSFPISYIIYIYISRCDILRADKLGTRIIRVAESRRSKNDKKKLLLEISQRQGLRVENVVEKRRGDLGVDIRTGQTELCLRKRRRIGWWQHWRQYGIASQEVPRMWGNPWLGVFGKLEIPISLKINWAEFTLASGNSRTNCLMTNCIMLTLKYEKKNV